MIPIAFGCGIVVQQLSHKALNNADGDLCISDTLP